MVRLSLEQKPEHANFPDSLPDDLKFYARGGVSIMRF
jgi:hypothetical protein